jgi:type III restriction enzyme/adenine-specific DNA-methyltransferase
LDNLGLAGTFSYPKTVYLIEYLLQLVDDGSTVLDFFSGSATTAEAVMQENSKRMLNSDDGINFIMVQLPVDLDEIVATSTGDALDTARKAINVLNDIHQPHTLDQIGIERIKRAAEKIKQNSPLFHGDLGFKHYTLKEPSALALEKIETFNPNSMIADSCLAEEFGDATILTTWMVRDGYTLTPDVKVLDLCGYEAYYCDKHIYLIHQNLSDEAIDALVTKFEDEATFNPLNVVVYGYAFNWAELQALKDNLQRLKVTDKNIRVNIDIRY